jgi:hypothetical protein
MKVNIGNDRNVGNAFTNLFERDRSVVVGNGEPHDLAAGTHHLFDLCDRSANVGGVRLSHRLNDYRSASADLKMLNLNWS